MEEGRYSSTILDLEDSGQLHAPAASPLGKLSQYPLDRRQVGLRAGLYAVK
jgi:hypothetical protein